MINGVRFDERDKERMARFLIELLPQPHPPNRPITKLLFVRQFRTAFASAAAKCLRPSRSWLGSSIGASGESFMWKIGSAT